MKYLPWFDVTNCVGDTTWIRADLVSVVNDDPKGLREIVVKSGPTIKTDLYASDIFERMGAAVEGAYRREMEDWEKENTQVSERYTEGVVSSVQARANMGINDPDDPDTWTAGETKSY